MALKGVFIFTRMATMEKQTKPITITMTPEQHAAMMEILSWVYTREGGLWSDTEYMAKKTRSKRQFLKLEAAGPLAREVFPGGTPG
jgi:hypothetical protein